MGTKSILYHIRHIGHGRPDLADRSLSMRNTPPFWPELHGLTSFTRNAAVPTVYHGCTVCRCRLQLSVHVGVVQAFTEGMPEVPIMYRRCNLRYSVLQATAVGIGWVRLGLSRFLGRFAQNGTD